MLLLCFALRRAHDPPFCSMVNFHREHYFPIVDRSSYQQVSQVGRCVCLGIIQNRQKHMEDTTIYTASVITIATLHGYDTLSVANLIS